MSSFVYRPIYRLVLPLVLLLLAACGGLSGEPEIAVTLPPATAAPPEISIPSSPPDLAVGAQIFAQNCTRCHGTNGAGDGQLVLTGQINNPGNFTQPDLARVQTPQEWFNTITNGKLDALMPPWKDSLTAQQRWNVALYTYTLSYTADQITRGETLWTANCGESCDSLTGVGSLTDLETMVSASDAELRAALPAAITDDNDAWAVVAYLRTRAVQNSGTVGQQVPPPAATEEVQSASGGPVTPGAASANVETGPVLGQIVNGTAGGGTTDGLSVRLFRWSVDFTPLEPLETTTDADGNYRFDAIELNPAAAYAAAVDYRDRRFISEFVRGTSNPLELPITVYEPTEDPSVITIRSLVNQMTAVGTGVQVVQVINFQNTSDRFYTSSNEVSDGAFASVVINLPPGSTVIGFPDDERRYVVSEDQSTVVDTLPVLPNEDHIVQLVYLVPYTGDAIIEQPLNYTLDGEVRVLLRPDALEVLSDQLSAIGPQTVGQNTYKGYGGTLQLSASDALSFELRGEPAPAAAELDQPQVVTSNNLIAVVGAVLIVLGLVIGGLYIVYRRRSGTPAPVSAPAPAAKPARSDDKKLIDALIRQIAELDEEHDRGQINHDLYRRQRKQLKKRLAELLGEVDE
ncbi:MAG: cytochrome c [Anaerolineae bacterium]|nr:cytochrome c [Anaerolineae bacterium]